MNNFKEKQWVADLENGQYRNPILYTDYSDPDAIRVGDDYFMIASKRFFSYLYLIVQNLIYVLL